jgi:deoxyribonuclease (pyrimidine dimer)
MTRINVVDPSLLTDQHAMAEYRELPMVLSALRRTLDSKSGLQRSKLPKTYTLNKGHVMFFYDKGAFLRKRFAALVDELSKRGYSLSPSTRQIDWTVFDRSTGLLNDWEPDSAAIAVNVARIIERIGARPTWYRFHGAPINASFVHEKYKQLWSGTARS